MRLSALVVALSLTGCAIPAVMATPAGIAAISATAGAVAASARLDQTIICALVSAEGIQEARSVSAVCQQAPAKP